MLSANTGTDIARAFSSLGTGRLPERPPVMIAFPSTLEPGWAPEGQGVVWLSTFVPWTPEQGQWDQALLEEASDLTWRTAEKALGWEMTAGREEDDRPAGMGRAARQPGRESESHRDEHRPADGDASLGQSFRLFDSDRRPVPDRGRHPSRRRHHRHARPQRCRRDPGGARHQQAPARCEDPRPGAH